MAKMQQDTQLTITNELGQYVLTLTDSVVTEENSTEYSLKGQLTVKELILFYLWNVQKNQDEQAEAREKANEATQIIEQLIERIWFERKENNALPSVRYDLVDVSRLNIKMERNGETVALPDRSNLQEYFNYFHQLVQVTLQSEPVASVLSSCLASYLREENEIKPKKQTRKRPPNKEKLAPAGEKLREGDIKMSIHGIRQAFGNQKQLPVFNQATPELWETRYGTPINNNIDRYGIDLTDLQFKVMEGVIMGLSQTKYQGNTQPKSKEELLADFGNIKKVEELPRIYQNIDKIPRLRVQQRELLRLCGIDESDQSEYNRGLEALNFLSQTQFCFYYTRLAFDKDGKPEKDPKTGDYKKERVEAIDTLIKVKTVRDEVTSEFKFYEIEPSAIFLDQKERYFLLIPFGWREEVKKVVGGRKASSYTMRFLLYLRYQFEERRRSNSHKRKGAKEATYEIRASWVDIAVALKMPESVYKGQKERAIRIIDQAYQVALTLGYLSSYKREGYQDILVFNPAKYPAPEDEKEPTVAKVEATV